MRFLIISHAVHYSSGEDLYAYAPYIREMNVWLKYVEEAEVIAPIKKSENHYDLPYTKGKVQITKIPSIDLTGFGRVLKSFFAAPYIFVKILFSMRHADHIHLRCPGNIGLLGCMAQIFFPLKAKTAKYAGNWDPRSKQPWSYKLQQYILSHERLTKNMTVLIYGEWATHSRNVKPFFTATYTQADKSETPLRKYDLPLRFLFVGSLVKGKRPMYALKLIHRLIEGGIPCELHFYGNGPLYKNIEEKIGEYALTKSVFLHGSKDANELKDAYAKTHFLILPSRSEGWPKVVAEAMWWGVIPIVTGISCVPWMLGQGSRGILIKGTLKKDMAKINKELRDKNALRSKSFMAQQWSRHYTLDRFETEIKKLL